MDQTEARRPGGGGGGGAVNGSGNPDGTGSEPKNTSSGVTFNFTDVSIASINKFSKIALRFLILLFFQTTDLLPHLFLKFQSIRRLAFITFVESKQRAIT